MTSPTSPPEFRRSQRREMDKAIEFVRKFAGPKPRRLAFISGSGLGGLAEVFQITQAIPYGRIPHFPSTTVIGHPGELLLGRLGPVEAMFFAGRVHLYEGLSPDDVTFAVRLAAGLGAGVLLLTNAAGGINPHFGPGDLMMITDHINLLFGRFPTLPPPRRAAGISAPMFRSPEFHRPIYDPKLSEMLRRAALEEKIDLKEGVYAGTFGPAYETRAESAMLREMGADAVGMSTVLEAEAAWCLGLRVAAVSTIANMVPAWGRPARKVAHSEVVARAGEGLSNLKKLVAKWGELIARDSDG